MNFLPRTGSTLSPRRPGTMRRAWVGLAPLAVALALALLLAAPLSARAEVNLGIGINLPGVSIGIDLPAQPQLVRVPGYPVFYAPQVASNFFFYDGLYWVYEDEDWYASSWYNGPWHAVRRDAVPAYVLRVPVRYYQAPPAYFQGWRYDAPPRWDDPWGPQWSRERRGWNEWDHNRRPAPAPLPTFQRRYPGSRYPAPEQQPQIQERNYHYQPRDEEVRQFGDGQGQRDRQQQQQQRDQQQQQRDQQHQQQQRDQQQQQDRPRSAPGRGAEAPPHGGRSRSEADRGQRDRNGDGGND